MSIPLTLSSVPAVTPYKQYVATGGQTVFPYPFPITQDSDLVVVINGVTQPTDSGYTLTGQGNPTGGNLTFTSGRTVGDIVTLFRNISIQRISQIAQNSGFSSIAFNAEYNQIYLILQQLQESIALCLQVPNSNNPAPTTTLTPANYASKYLAFDSNGNPTPALLTSSGSLTAAIIGGLMNPRTTAEITAGVTPVSFVYLPGDLRRYGAAIDGSTDDTTAVNNAIKVAIAGLGFVYHPGGTCVHASQILFATNAAGLTIYGHERSDCVFKYTGSTSSSAWRVTNNTTTPSSPTANSSGAGLVNFEGVTVTTAIGSSTAAGIEINACGFAFYNITRCRVTGTFKYGVILDGVELGDINNCIIDNAGGGIANAANVWIVNGADRTGGQSTGFTNSIWVHNCQLNIGTASGTNNIADDGGSNHYFRDNNCNGAQVAIRMCGVGGFEITGNEIENGLGGGALGEANIDMLVLTLASNSVGPNLGGVVSGNFFGSDMAAGGSSLNFAGSGTLHYGIRVHGNYFRNNSGAASDINVNKLGNSVCGPNYSLSTGFHYSNIHNDSNGNELLPPQNGYPGTLQSSRIFGDTRLVNQFAGGVSADSPNGLQIDEQQWQNFTIQIVNTAGTLQVQTFDSGVNGGAAAYANKITNESSSAVNLPTVSSGAGFSTASAGLLSGSTSILILNVANGQVSGKNNCYAFIEQYNGNVAVYSVYCGIASRNINGVTIQRPEIRLVNAQSGAAVNFDTTLLPSGKVINIRFAGYLA